MILDKEKIEIYCGTLSESVAAKVKTALRAYAEWKQAHPEGTIDDFAAENPKGWKVADQYVEYVRRYLASQTEQREENTVQEPQKAPTMRGNGLKKQVGVYLKTETYEVLHALAKLKETSIGELLAAAGDGIAEKNRDLYEQAKSLLSKAIEF